PSPSHHSPLSLPAISAPTFTNSPSHIPPANDNNDAASDITYTSGAKITGTALHEEDPSLPDNQLDNHFALISDGSWEADTIAKFPEAVGKHVEVAAEARAAGEQRPKPSYPAAEEGVLAQMSVTETSEELRAGFEESMRRVRARGVEEEEDERREAEEKAKVARWQAEEWEREKAAEAARTAQARREENKRVALAQREWEEERERSDEDERRREEAADEAAKEGAGNANAADPAEAETKGIQVSQFILCMPSPKRDAPRTTLPRGGKPAAPKTPAGSSDDDNVPDSNASHVEDAKWRKVEGAKRRKREEEKVMKVNASVRRERAGKRLVPLYSTSSSSSLSDYDALLQEHPPRISSHPLPKGWTLLLPTPHTPEEPDDDRARSAILLSPTYQPSDVHQRPVPSRDLVDVELRVKEGESVRLLSIYNPSLFAPSPSATALSPTSFPPSSPPSPLPPPLLLAGDFNLRHPAWDPLLLDPPSDEAENA
ncbi:hypothetical protein JCM11251_003015, partial [Rhodosporidiobolus azoricus]